MLTIGVSPGRSDSYAVWVKNACPVGELGGLLWCEGWVVACGLLLNGGDVMADVAVGELVGQAVREPPRV